MRMSLFLLLCLLVPYTASADEFAVVQCALPTTNGGTVDCTSSGFGTPLGAFFWGGYGVTNGTVASHNGIWFGAYDGTRQHSRGFASEDAQLDSDTGAVTDADSALITLLETTQVKDGDCTASLITDGVRLTCADAPPAAFLTNVILIGGSGVTNVYTNTATANATQDATQAISAPGFTPDLVLAWSINNDTVNYANSFGWATNEAGPTIVQRAMSLTDSNADASMIVSARLATNRLVTIPLAGGAIGTVELTAFDPSGFTVTTRDAPQAKAFSYLAIKFSGRSVKTMTANAPAGTGADSVTGVGFQPQFGLMLQGENASVDTDFQTNNGEVFGLSAFTSTASASSAVWSNDGAGTSNTDSMTDNTVCRTRKDVADYSTCTLTSFDADGPTFNYTTNVGGAKPRALLFVQAGATAASFGPLKRRAQ